jgi:hypothetical protein
MKPIESLIWKRIMSVAGLHRYRNNQDNFRQLVLRWEYPGEPTLLFFQARCVMMRPEYL